MALSHRSIARLGIASLLGAVAAFAASPARAASACDPSTLTCAVASVDAKSLHAQLKGRLPTEIDSGWMEKGPIKVRTRFTIDPAGGDPIVSLEMPGGAVEASWHDKGVVVVRPVADAGAQGTMKVHYKLAPSLEANIYGATVAYDASELVNLVPGAAFGYDQQASAPWSPWGFAGAKVTTPAPPLDQSTIFSIPFETLGVSPDTAEGTLAIQAATSPTFTYKTRAVKLDADAIPSADGSAKIAIDDADALDVNVDLSGEVSFEGSLDVKPVVTIDSVAGIPTFGLTKFSFSAVTKPYAGGPLPVSFDHSQVHIPLPNVKVPSAPVDMGSAGEGQEQQRKVTIKSTGELGARLTIESSDPQFVVPKGTIEVAPKSTYDLALAFRPTGTDEASATITVRSNDPDSPEQTFRVAANGATLDPEDPSSPASGGDGAPAADASSSDGEGGCSVAAPGARAPGLGALGLALGLALALRRRRET